MIKNIVRRKSKSINIDHRIDLFIKKLDQEEEMSQKTTSIIRNEKRWLGIVEGKVSGYSMRSVKTYLTRYRKAVAEHLPFNYRYKASLDKVVKQFGDEELVSDL